MFECGIAKTTGHSAPVLHTHLLFVTKVRRGVFTGPHLEEIMWAACGDFEVELAEFNGETVHTCW